MIKPWFHLFPGRYILYKAHLVLQRHHGVIFGGVDVEHVVLVLGAQVVGDVGERGARRLGDSVINDHQVLLLI